jgi:hypothetical protein
MGMWEVLLLTAQFYFPKTAQKLRTSSHRLPNSFSRLAYRQVGEKQLVLKMVYTLRG